MKLRELVGEDAIKTQFKDREDLPVWDEELSEEDVAKLTDESYMAGIETEHRELQAYMTSLHGNSKYRPSDLAKWCRMPETHAYAFLAKRGRPGQGFY